MRQTVKLLAAWLSLALFAPDGGLEGAEPLRVRVGYPSPSASFSPLFVAKEGGAFEKYGLAPELLYLQGVQITQVHVSGQVDFTVTGAPLPLRAAVEGADLVLVAGSIDKFIYKLIARPGIGAPAGLKGKTIGITTFGSLPDVAIRLVLRRWGMNPDSDVTLVQVGRMSDMVVALSAGKIDAGVISDPTSFQAEKIGMKRLLDMADVDVEFANVAVAVSRSYAKARREMVLRFLKAYIEGTRLFMTDRELAVRALRKYTGAADREILEKTYDLFASKYIKKVPVLSVRSVENTLAMIADRSPKARGRRAAEFIDASFIAELEASGFIRSVWP
ncbi:MAG TPA: ABC transporter substrate-binding protein [candidate division Zixibacteria bacterium]|nr:ABC transporter substrate-binding protein [candidate division Zixibacteria bacterium]